MKDMEIQFQKGLERYEKEKQSYESKIKSLRGAALSIKENLIKTQDKKINQLNQKIESLTEVIKSRKTESQSEIEKPLFGKKTLESTNAILSSKPQYLESAVCNTILVAAPNRTFLDEMNESNKTQYTTVEKSTNELVVEIHCDQLLSNCAVTPKKQPGNKPASCSHFETIIVESLIHQYSDGSLPGFKRRKQKNLLRDRSKSNNTVGVGRNEDTKPIEATPTPEPKTIFHKTVTHKQSLKQPRSSHKICNTKKPTLNIDVAKKSSTDTCQP
ncbi:hypothetical protein J6590_002554 [Homalodisca vitripennis]|nr:hypothetical protein J6590_002554 [Homalodisca vitripennis]